jgi:anaerobic C4-dicarboxylate transporter
MYSQIGFIIKVLILSTVLSIAIVYVGPVLAIAPTQFNALLAILIPVTILVVALLWRTREREKFTD